MLRSLSLVDGWSIRILSVGIPNQALPTTMLIMYPTVRFVPKWFPFASFQRQAEIYRKEFSRIDTVPHAWAKEQIVRSRFFVNAVA